MRVVLQRVNYASVSVNDSIVGKINKGLLTFLGVGQDDDIKDIEYLVDKIINLRIFEDENEKMNLSLVDLGYEMLVVSQFTLYGDSRKGRRPNFMEAANPEKARSLYNNFIQLCNNKNIMVQSGQFQANMKINLQNDGPVTMILDSKKIY